MSWWTRAANVFRRGRLTREIDEEFQAHIQEAIENGRDPAEARQAFGSLSATRDRSRDVRVVPWLDSLWSDIDLARRQLIKGKAVSAAVILSLGLAFGACVAAFRLADAVLLRPLPIDRPERLYSLTKQGSRANGKPFEGRTFDYPLFRRLRATAEPRAELLAVSFSRNTDLTYGSDQEMEKAYRQYVSGGMFEAFGIRPAIGRLLTEDDDRTPQGHPYAVLSHDYWRSRFGADPEVIGRTFRMDDRLFEIVGVVAPGFSGTEPGAMTEIFIPTMMHSLVERSGPTWFQTLTLVEDRADIQSLTARMEVVFASHLEQRVTDFRERRVPEANVKALLSQRLRLKPAPSGASSMQGRYRQALVVLSVLAALVLLIACANVANLMAARASSRAREMALRVAIGAGRKRLIQLVLTESALIALAAAAVGGLLAWGAAPLIVGMIDLPSGPARLRLPFDWRVFGFGLGLTLAATISFGLGPALRASAVRPVNALKEGRDPYAQRCLMDALLAAQVAFCFAALFLAGLFVATLDRLANQPTGYSAERLLAVETVARQPRAAVFWNEIAAHLRALPGVESVSLAAWPLMSGTRYVNSISVGGEPPSDQPVYVMEASPGWIGSMRIPLHDGRDLRESETHPGTALVNAEFANEFFNGRSPVGEVFALGGRKVVQVEVVGLVGSARYDEMRESVKPTIYVPFASLDEAGRPRPRTRASFIIRTSVENPLVLADALRHEVGRARSEFYVTNITTQQELDDSQMVRERLLAVLASFFAAVALILTAVGVYGVLHYSVVQRRREIGICIALGAGAVQIAKRVSLAALAAVTLGSICGLFVGIGIESYIRNLLWGVNATDPAMLAVPALTILAAASAAAPVVMRAVRIDPADLLRAD